MSYLKEKSLDPVRQVLAITERILQEKGMIAEVALANWASKVRVDSTKFEAKEMKEGRIKTTVTNQVASGYFDDTAKDLVVWETKNILVWDLFEFRTATNGTITDLIVWVDSKTNDTTIKVKKVGWTDALIPAGAMFLLKTSTNQEVSSKSSRPMNLPSTIFNYPQIIRETREVSGRTVEINNYDFDSAVAEARRQTLEYFGRQLDAICMSSFRWTTTLGWEERDIAWGLPYFADNVFDSKWVRTWPSVGNVVDAEWAELTQTMIDNGFQYVIENNGRLNSILTSPAQARKISSFDEGKIIINYDQLANAENQSRWGSVQVLKSPITINGNVIDKIYVSTAIAKDEARMFDRSKMYLVPMKNREYNETTSDYYSTDAAIDGVSVSMLGDWTFIFENADVYTYSIKNLAY